MGGSQGVKDQDGVFKDGVRADGFKADGLEEGGIKDDGLNSGHGSNLATVIRRVRPAKPLRRVGESMGFVREDEPDGQGGVVATRTYFLVGSECRFSCSMCDLWKYTLDDPVTPLGSLVAQIDALEQQCSSVQPQGFEGASETGKEWLKLYNAANFFDERNVASLEREWISERCAKYSRVIVENHAALFQSKSVQQETLRFRDRLKGELEVALGLETIDPNAMKLLNKSMRLDQFEAAVDFLRGEGIHSRAFVLLGPPGTEANEQKDWALKACLQATQWGVGRSCVIPTRKGNGWTDLQFGNGGWVPPKAEDLEDVLDELLLSRTIEPQSLPLTSVVRPVYTVDLWDWELLTGPCTRQASSEQATDRYSSCRYSSCEIACRTVRKHRLEQMNLLQDIIPRVNGGKCLCPEG